MPQDNKNNLVQFCQELGITVDEILYNSNELLLAIEDLVYLYRPKTQEESGEFYSIRHKLPGSVRLLCDLQKNTMPDDDEFYDTVAPLKDMAIDVASRMVSANIMINDIIDMYFIPHEDNMYIHLHLTMLGLLKDGIYNARKELENIYREISVIYPDLLVLDDDIEEEEKEETILPDDVESFQIMRNILIKALTKYINKHKTDLFIRFFAAVQDYLEDFANGIELDNEFDFSFSLQDAYRQLKYINFHFEAEIIEITSGGSVYDEYVGSDSYTDWMYGVGLNGWEDYNYNCDFSEVYDLINCGAKLNIYDPEEFVNTE